MRGRELRSSFLRFHQESPAALVQYERFRQPSKGCSAPRQAKGGLKAKRRIGKWAKERRIRGAKKSVSTATSSTSRTDWPGSPFRPFAHSPFHFLRGVSSSTAS